MAYLDFVESGGRTYVYISEYVGDQQFSAKKEIRIARLGRAEQALMQLKIWEMDNQKIPAVVNTKDHARIPEWINTVRNRVAY